MKKVLSPISEKKMRRKPDTKPSRKGLSPTRPGIDKARSVAPADAAPGTEASARDPNIANASADSTIDVVLECRAATRPEGIPDGDSAPSTTVASALATDATDVCVSARTRVEVRVRVRAVARTGDRLPRCEHPTTPNPPTPRRSADRTPRRPHWTDCVIVCAMNDPIARDCAQNRRRRIYQVYQ